VSLARFPGYYASSKSTSPTTSFLDESNSICPADLGSLVLTSLGSAAQHPEGLYDLRPIAAAHASREQSSDFSIPVCSSSFIYQPRSTSTILPPLSHTSQYNETIDSSPNRLFRESTWLPSIAHDGKILSHGGDHAYDRAGDVGSSVLLVDHPQLSRASLQPVQSLGSTLSRSIDPSRLLPQDNRLKNLVIPPHLQH
jgi:hypothetical protein